jgi:DNA-binding transcriptional regulator YdaS (Cro superfamily)
LSAEATDLETMFGPGPGASEEDMRARRMEWLRVAVTRGGGIVKFAKALGISLQAVDGWKRRGHVPFDRAATIEQMFGVAREELVAPELARAYLTPRDIGSSLL